jgi:hemoglobin-like flavoprotein
MMGTTSDQQPPHNDLSSSSSPAGAAAAPSSSSPLPSPYDETLERRKKLVKQSWRAVEFGLGGAATQAFYERLFTRFPSVQPMFAGTTMDVQAAKLYAVLRVAIRSLDDLDSLVPVLQNMGVRHATAYGVQRAHYGAVTQVFIEILYEFIGNQWSENMSMSGATGRYMVEVADAWTWVLNLLGGVMADAADTADISAAAAARRETRDGDTESPPPAAAPSHV